jgi:PAS domain S-box-containing protein
VHELEVHQIELEMQNEELRQAHNELELSRNTYAELYDFAPVGYFIFDRHGLVQEVNLTGAQLLGIERQKLTNKSFTSFIADADGREIYASHLESVMQKQGMQRCQIRLTGKDGSVVYGQLKSVPLDNIGKKDGYILCSIVDGTLGKQMETEIQDAREYAENIVETVREPLVVLNSDLKILTANHSFYDTFKVTPEETIGNFIYDLGNRQWDIPKLRVLFEDILPHNSMFNCYEVEHVFPGIGHKTILLNARQIFRENIGSHIILLAMEDITERKQLGEELQNAHDELEIIVHERTKELIRANMQLTQEIEERKRAEGSLQGTYAEIKLLKDRLQAENIYLQQEVAQEYNFGEIIGQSDLLSQVFFQVEQVAPMNATVLLLGETGTGKGVVARAIHSSSTRKNRPLITVDCTTLPATLVESELFGREKGAFTGSDSRQIGRFELADGGTIFLDEIGEMPLDLQSKLLRIIQDGEFERLGSSRTIKTDVRIIAATNRNLEEEIKNGRFREDLFYRLNVFPITVPPLRQRKEDIPLLVNHFVAKFNKKISKQIETVSKETLNTLQEYHWPGNVRELESVIERAVITSQGTALQVLDRFDTFSRTEDPAGQEIKALADLEHDHILHVLQKTGWRIEGKNGAAGLLDLNASTLRARMRKYGIVRQ